MGWSTVGGTAPSSVPTALLAKPPGCVVGLFCPTGPMPWCRPHAERTLYTGDTPQPSKGVIWRMRGELANTVMITGTLQGQPGFPFCSGQNANSALFLLAPSSSSPAPPKPRAAFPRDASPAGPRVLLPQPALPFCFPAWRNREE